ncbi:unnamed protein product, partial [Allacma fusca]
MFKYLVVVLALIAVAAAQVY